MITPMWLQNWREWPCVIRGHRPARNAAHLCRTCGHQLRELPAPDLA